MEELKKRIIETVTWMTKINPDYERNFFRTNVIKPKKSIFSDSNLNIKTVQNVIKKRRKALKNTKLLLLGEVQKLGKIIFANPTESITDGAAQDYSKGYFDVYEFPPWDTWIGVSDEFEISKNYILAWVPNSWLNYVYSGKEVSLMDNICWFNEISSKPKGKFFDTLFTWEDHLEFQEYLDYRPIQKMIDKIDKEKRFFDY